MKKQVFAACTLAACAMAAQAQSNVTIYGVLDAYLGYTKADGKASMFTVDPGAYQADRVGFRGSEDLGGGLKASFTLENGFLADTGGLADSTRLFNRQAWIGLGSSIGEFRAGRQNTPAFNMLGQMDAFSGATFGSFLNNVSGYAPRYDNMVGWQSVDMGGARLQAHVSLGERAAPRSGLNTYILAAEYKSGPFWLGANTARQNSADTSVHNTSSFVGANYDYGNGKLYAGVFRGNNIGASMATNVAGRYYTAYSLSANYRLNGAITVGAGYGWAKDGTAAGNDAHQFSLIATQDLSKRTMLFSTYAHLANKNTGAFALGAAGPITKNTPAAGGDVDGLQVGVRHLF